MAGIRGGFGILSSSAVLFLLLSYNPSKCLPPTSNPAPTCQALQVRPFLIKKDTLNVSLAGTQSIGGLRKAKRVITTRSISTPLIIYLVPLWLRSASESLMRREKDPNTREE